jgi:hypothetical protein
LLFSGLASQRAEPLTAGINASGHQIFAATDDKFEPVLYEL